MSLWSTLNVLADEKHSAGGRAWYPPTLSWERCLSCHGDTDSRNHSCHGTSRPGCNTCAGHIVEPYVTAPCPTSPHSTVWWRDQLALCTVEPHVTAVSYDSASKGTVAAYVFTTSSLRHRRCACCALDLRELWCLLGQDIMQCLPRRWIHLWASVHEGFRNNFAQFQRQEPFVCFVLAFTGVFNAPDRLGWMVQGKEFETQRAAPFENRCNSLSRTNRYKLVWAV